MTSFLYYVPGHQAEMISHEQIIKAGIGYVFDKPGDVTVNLLRSSGPDGKSGAIITNPLRIEPGRNQFKPDLQMWLPPAVEGGVWVGMWNDAQPGPENLQRRKMLRGRTLELADEREWMIPIGCRWSESDNTEQWFRLSCALPAPLAFGANDVFLSKPFERYAQLWAICEIDARRQSGGEVSDAERSLVSGVGAVFSAVKVLAANYAVNTAEVELLELFNQDTPREILDVFCDWETWDELAEKKTAEFAGQASSSGPEGTLQTIGQP
jgi:hypothetical protein